MLPRSVPFILTILPFLPSRYCSKLRVMQADLATFGTPIQQVYLTEAIGIFVEFGRLASCAAEQGSGWHKETTKPPCLNKT